LFTANVLIAVLITVNEFSNTAVMYVEFVVIFYTTLLIFDKLSRFDFTEK